MDLFERGRPLQFLGGVTKNFLVGGTVVDAAAIHVYDCNHVSRTLANQPEKAILLVQMAVSQTMLLLLENYIDIEQQEQTQQSIHRFATGDKLEEFSPGTKQRKGNRCPNTFCQHR